MCIGRWKMKADSENGLKGTQPILYLCLVFAHGIAEATSRNKKVKLIFEYRYNGAFLRNI